MKPRVRLSSLLHGRRGERIIALVVAVLGTAILTQRPLALVDPPSCPGLFDLVLVATSRTASDVPIGSLLVGLNTPLIFVALGVITQLLLAVSGSATTALAVGLAATAAGLLQPALAVSSAASLAACGLCWLLVAPMVDRRSRASANARTQVIAATALAFAAAVTPPLGAALALAAAWLGWRGRAHATGRRALAATLGALAVLGCAAATSAAIAADAPMNATMACLIPQDIRTALTLVPTQWPGATGMTPLALSLTALGLWSLFPLRLEHRAPATGLAAFLLFASLFIGQAPGVWAPAVVAGWALAAIGLREARSTLTGSSRARFGAGVIAAALVVLQLLRHTAPPAAADLQPRGHEHLSREQFVDLIRTMPEGSALVAEDTITAILIRALPRDLRSRRELGALPRDRSAIVSRVASSRAVYALPRAQSHLQHLGFQLVPVLEAPGLAEVRAGGECSAPLTGAWQSIPVASGERQFTVAADSESSRGPIYIFAAAEQPLDPRPVDWPSDALRGFHPLGHQLSDPTTADRLARDLSDYGLRLDAFGAAAAGQHLARVEMWRTPRAPLRLTVAFDAPVRQVLARLASVESGDQIAICPAYGSAIVPIQPVATR